MTYCSITEKVERKLGQRESHNVSSWGWSDLVMDGISISSDHMFKQHALIRLRNFYLVIIKFKHYRQQRTHKTKQKGKSIRMISRHLIYFTLLRLCFIIFYSNDARHALLFECLLERIFAWRCQPLARNVATF
jgi:hypothetical protein